MNPMSDDFFMDLTLLAHRFLSENLQKLISQFEVCKHASMQICKHVSFLFENIIMQKLVRYPTLLKINNKS